MPLSLHAAGKAVVPPRIALGALVPLRRRCGLCGVGTSNMVHLLWSAMLAAFKFPPLLCSTVKW